MTRYTIRITDSRGNNCGSPLVMQRTGRIKACQFLVFGDMTGKATTGEGPLGEDIQLSTQATYQEGAPSLGQNPSVAAETHVGGVLINVTTATQAQAAVQYFNTDSGLIPADFPYTQAVSFYLNSTTDPDPFNALNGLVILYCEE